MGTEGEVMVYKSETAKIRDRVLEYCRGSGVDIGCGIDKIKSDTLGVDCRELEGVDVCADASGKLGMFTDQQFDYVYSSHFLEHVESPIDCLQEWNRILKEGGYLVLYLPHKDYYTEENSEHKQELTQEVVLQWLEEVGGLRVIRNEMDIGVDRYSFLIIARLN